MAPSGHAKLSPSAGKRWLTCPGSVRLAADCVPTTSAAADEGTAGHDLFEKCIRLGKKAKFYQGEVIKKIKVTPEMVGWVQEALDWVLAYKAAHAGAVLHPEQKVNIGPVFGLTGDECWGTTDLTIVTGKELVISDLKLGYGDVEVLGNVQLLLYAAGWRHELSHLDFDRVRLVILQPRSGGVKEWDFEASMLDAWVKEQTPAVRAALQPSAPLVPSEEGCRWCPASGACPALQEQALAVARREFGSIETLSLEGLAELLDKAEMLENAVKAARRHALQLTRLGQTVPGWKAVKGRKNRVWSDEAAAAKVLTKLGHEPWEKSLITPAAAEKLAGKDVLAKLITTPEGEPTLVRMEDKRPALPPEFPPVAPDGLIE